MVLVHLKVLGLLVDQVVVVVQLVERNNTWEDMRERRKMDNFLHKLLEIVFPIVWGFLPSMPQKRRKEELASNPFRAKIHSLRFVSLVFK